MKRLWGWIVCQFKKHDFEPGHYDASGVWVPIKCRRCGLRLATIQAQE